MSEWWTYRPEDFLLFSPRVYWRMFDCQCDPLAAASAHACRRHPHPAARRVAAEKFCAVARTLPRDSLDLRRVVLPVEPLFENQLGCRLCRVGLRG